MPFSVNTLRSNLTGGGARPTLFQVVITNPIDGSADLKTPFMVQATAIPTYNVGIINVPYMGRIHKEPGDRTYEDWTVTIINDEDFLIRNALEAWQGSINRFQRNIRDTGSSSNVAYASQAIVTQFSKTGAILREYQFNNIWPTNIGPISLDWSATDTYEQFDVTFAVDDVIPLVGATGNAGGA